MDKIRIGTRGSELALAQCELVAAQLRSVAPGIDIETVVIQTTGDRLQKLRDKDTGAKSLTNPTDKKEWVDAIEQAIESGDVDLAIHSGKDIPAEISTRTKICSVLERANPMDALVGVKGLESLKSFHTGRELLLQLPHGACVGTSSVRRKAQLLRLRSDLDVVVLRGNVPTRVRKVEELEEMDAGVLAAAGLERLGLTEKISAEFGVDEMLPAVCQGTLVAQYMSENAELDALVARVVDPATNFTFDAERGFIEVIGADCKSALGVYAEVCDREIKLRAIVLSDDGQDFIAKSEAGEVRDARLIGENLAGLMLKAGAQDLL